MLNRLTFGLLGKPTENETWRIVYINNKDENAKLCKEKLYKGNQISTARYNVLNFFPKTLFEFFRVTANMYFLFIAVLQLATTWSPTNRYTTAGPLVIILLVTLIKQGIEDSRRHHADEVQNNRTCKVLASDGKLCTRKWREIIPGDILLLESNEEVPADIIVLNTSEEEGRCYIETANLDGETNLKHRTALDRTAKYIGYRGINEPALDKEKQLLASTQLKGLIKYEEPNNRLYNFTGALKVGDDEGVPVGPTNVILRGCTIKTCNYVIGIVIFCGSDTKLMQNTRSTPSKQSNVYKTVNKCVLIIFITQCALCIISAFCNYFQSSSHAGKGWYLPASDASVSTAIISFFTFLILYNNLVPLSLYVSLDLIKTAQAQNIANDEDMRYEEFHAIARTSELNEELGQIQYIFSDKTGTLTRNCMEFRKCSIGGIAYGFGSTEIGDAARKSVRQFNSAPSETSFNNSDHTKDSSDHTSGAASQVFLDPKILFNDPRLLEALHHGDSKTQFLIDEFLSLLVVNNTVIPEFNKVTNQMEYRASSPDEEALVKAAKCFGYNLVNPAPDLIVEVTKDKNFPPRKRRYSVLNINEFNSTRKRMSCVVRMETGEIVMYCKGADNVMLKLSVEDENRKNLELHLEDFAKEGLRTLVLARKTISEEDYNNWNEKYLAASRSLENRDEKLDTVAEEIEKDMCILGATAIEDKLQEGVPKTIKHLHQAGIKIWVLTGDKEETAINIGYACKLLNENMHLLFINKEKREELVQQVDMLCEIPEIKTKGKTDENNRQFALVCDGKALTHIFPSHASGDNDSFALCLSRKLLQVASCCNAVIASRVSPAQKADIVALVQHNIKPEPITLAIGDGANDVNMIQTARVGVGLCGKEGVQAINASDYAIAQFRFLEKLLLVHGRNNYKRISKVILYSFYKNGSLVLTLFFYNFFNLQSGTSFFESFILAGWNFFLALPIILHGVYEQDISPNSIMNKYQNCYIAGTKNSDLNVSQFCLWILNAFLHASICSSLAYFMVDDSESCLYVQGTVFYTGLLLTMHGKCCLETTYWTRLQFIIFGLSFAFYYVFVIMESSARFLNLPDYGLYSVLYQLSKFWFTTLIVPIVALLSDLCILCIQGVYNPSPEAIIRERTVLNIHDTKVRSAENVPQKPVMVKAASPRDLSKCRSSEPSMPGPVFDAKKNQSSDNVVRYSSFAFTGPERHVGKNADIVTDKVFLSNPSLQRAKENKRSTLSFPNLKTPRSGL